MLKRGKLLLESTFMSTKQLPLSTSQPESRVLRPAAAVQPRTVHVHGTNNHGDGFRRGLVARWVSRAHVRCLDELQPERFVHSESKAVIKHVAYFIVEKNKAREARLA